MEKLVTKFVNDLGDRLIIHEGRSDNGELGSFVSESFFREKTGKDVITPLVFFKTENDALDGLDNVALNFGFKKV